jgi:hypothetical protein
MRRVDELFDREESSYLNSHSSQNLLSTKGAFEFPYSKGFRAAGQRIRKEDGDYINEPAPVIAELHKVAPSSIGGFDSYFL